MPTIQNTDDFVGASFAVPGTGPYNEIGGTPTEDNTVVPPGQTAAMLIDRAGAAEYVGYQIPTPGSIGWCGFWWRLDTADEPAADMSVCIWYSAGFTQTCRMTFEPAANVLRINSGSDTETAFPTFDTWHWIEMIRDCSTSTIKLAARMDEVDFSSVPETADATGIPTYVYPGTAQAMTSKQRFGYMQIGTAASLTDWQGVPRGPVGHLRLGGPVLLGTAAEALFSVSSDQRAIIDHIRLVNNTDSPVDVTMSIGADAASTRLWDSKTLAAGLSRSVKGPFTMEAGELFQAFAGTADAVTITVLGKVEGL